MCPQIMIETLPTEYKYGEKKDETVWLHDEMGRKFRKLNY